MNKIIEKKGEMFVFQKLMDVGWKLSRDNSNLSFLGLMFEKNGRKIKIIVKTSLKTKSFKQRGKKDFNYLIFTNLSDIWVIPVEMLNNCEYPNKTLKKLKNALNLLDLSKKELLLGINDFSVHFSEMFTVSPFFVQNVEKTPQLQEVLSNDT